jgi:hypothetical protein
MLRLGLDLVERVLLRGRKKRQSQRSNSRKAHDCECMGVGVMTEGSCCSHVLRRYKLQADDNDESRDKLICSDVDRGRIGRRGG